MRRMRHKVLRPGSGKLMGVFLTLFIGGAKADNVIWAVAVSSTLGTNVIFKGNILAGSSNSLGVGSVIEAQLLCRTGQVTLLSNTISLPTP